MLYLFIYLFLLFYISFYICFEVCITGHHSVTICIGQGHSSYLTLTAEWWALIWEQRLQLWLGGLHHLRQWQPMPLPRQSYWKERLQCSADLRPQEMQEAWHKWPVPTACYSCNYEVFWRNKKIDIFKVHRTEALWTSVRVSSCKANKKFSSDLQPGSAWFLYTSVQQWGVKMFPLDWRRIKQPGRAVVYAYRLCYTETFSTQTEVRMTYGGCRSSDSASSAALLFARHH